MKSTKPNAHDLAESAILASQRERDAWKMALASDDVIPPGYRCSIEWGKIWEKCETSTRGYIATLVASKKMERKHFKVRQLDGVPRSKPYYRLV